MMEITKPVRLSKVAREFNVGIDTIVDYLDGRGIEVERSPNTKINPDIYEMLLDVFEDEKKLKEKAKSQYRTRTEREKITLKSSMKEESEEEEIELDMTQFERSEKHSEVVKKSEDALTKQNEITNPLIANNGFESNHHFNNSFNELVESSNFTETYLKDIIDTILRKKQIILQGPPGTGKSFLAKSISHFICDGKASNQELIQFHQSYSYEDFIEGIKIDNKGDFRLTPGIFMDFCLRAKEISDQNFCIVIDELNRANIARVFGELLFLLENRDLKLKLKHTTLTVPKNIFVIGTMNTADRSLEKIDLALRRRFAFFDILPDYDILKKLLIQSNSTLKVDKFILNLKTLNSRISLEPSLGPNFAIGISFFLDFKPLGLNDLDAIWRFQLAPLLDEYFFEDKEKIEELRTTLFNDLKQ